MSSMKLVAVTITRNDDWSLGLALRSALRWCDAVVVLDHASEDSTPDLLSQLSKDYPGRVVRLSEPNTGRWSEMDNRQRTLEAARNLNASHVAIVDSDELLTDNLIAGVRDRIAQAEPGITYGLPQVSAYHSLVRRRVDGPWGRTSTWSLAFRLTPDVHWRADDGYHLHHRQPYGANQCRHLIPGDEFFRLNLGGVIHLQHSSYRRLRAKAVWYKLLETVSYPGRRDPAFLNRMYDWTLRTENAEVVDLPGEWWGENRPLAEAYLDLAKTPWQESEARRLWQEHGAAKFAGIDLHGLVLD